MQLAAPNNLLGIGLYTPAEAALYARIAPQTLSRWLFGSSGGKAVLDPQIEGERIVTFLDFIQAMAVRSIRNTKKIPLPKIREGVRIAQEEFGIEYPLAKKHTIFLFNDEVIVNVGDTESRRFLQASGKNKRNYLLTKVAELFVDDIGFDPEGFAAWYKAFEHKSYTIKMDPKLRFGEPMIAECGYSAQALWDAYRSEGGIENAAKVYGVKEGEVETACRYFDQILQKTAA
jgi:uncharacterized protein (DUF433 family)